MAAVHGDVHGHDDHHDHHPTGIMRWVTTTNHKDIGTMYLWFSLAMFFTGGFLAMGIRAELFQPGIQILEPELFNSFTTLHGLIMVFGAVMPAFVANSEEVFVGQGKDLLFGFRQYGKGGWIGVQPPPR